MMPVKATTLESRPESIANQSESSLYIAGKTDTIGAGNIASVQFAWDAPTLPWDPEQAWFWTSKWRQMEAEASDDIAAGRLTRFADDDDFERAMDELLSDADL